MDKYYITTPIYYVNDVPHIGHAYTTIAADVLARYWQGKLGKQNVFFLTGTDEHGAKVAQAARDAGQRPKEFADSVAPRFQNAWKLLNIKYDYFIRTTDPRHERLAQEALQKIYDKGYIHQGIYDGLYCEGCEKFLTEADLTNGKCPLHLNKEPVRQEEKNYFFKLSSFKDRLINLFSTGGVEILPKSRKNEVLGKLKLGLEDISISRAGVSWGIPVPWDSAQTIYVWVEALFNYHTATQFVGNKEKFWPADVHLLGKDILWFHTVIWCALLLAAELPLPKKIFAHGFFTINGQKMSKSLGNVISPQELVDKFGADASRYLLLSEFPFGQDGDFSFEKLTTQYNAELANGLGNLVSRVARLAEQAEIKNQISKIKITDSKFKSFCGALEEFRFHDATTFINDKVTGVNKFIDQHRPWGQKGETLEATLNHLVAEIKEIALLLKPFLPETSEKIEKQFAGPKIASAPPLFPRL